MKYQINVADRGGVNGLYLLKMRGVEDIVGAGNNENFARIIADRYVIIDGHNNNRVFIKYNPHIADELRGLGISNYWRITNVSDCYVTEDRPYSIDDIVRTGRRISTIEVDFETAAVSRYVDPNAIECPECGEAVEQGELYDGMCKNCFTSRGLGRYYSYHDYEDGYPTPKGVKTSKTIVMGCEIERDFVSSLITNADDRDRASDAYRSYRTDTIFELCKILYGNELKKTNVKRKAVFMSDGSLNMSGIEWITFPNTLTYYKKNKAMFDSALAFLKTRGYANSDSVGNHIHINRDFFGNKTNDGKLGGCKMALEVSIFWNEILAISKRQRTNYTRKPSVEKDDDIWTLVEKSISSSSDHSVAINMQHSKTIECRIWSGIDTMDDLLLYLDMTQALAKAAKNNTIEKIQKMDFITILKELTIKENLAEVKKRLNAARITAHNGKIDKLINGGKN